MLKLTSRFVLEVLPYLLMALAAIVVLPGAAGSLIAAALPVAASPETKTGNELFGQGETTLDLIRQDHEAFPSSRFAAKDELKDR